MPASALAFSVLALCLAPSDSTLRGTPSDGGDGGAGHFDRSVLEHDISEWFGSDAAALEAMMNVPCRENPRGLKLETRSPQVHGCSKECLLSEVSASAQKYCVGEKWDKVKCKQAIAVLRERAWPHIQMIASGVHGWAFGPGFRGLNATLSAPREPHTGTFRAGGGYASKVACRQGGGEAHLFYRHIWKDAGSAIIYNMQALGHGLVTGGGDWEQNRRCEELQDARASPEAGHKPVLFTFVRNPIGKFVAGYKEMSYRNLIDDVRGFKVGQYQHAINFIDLVLTGSCDNGHVLLQASNLMSSQCESNFDFIGRLESFDEDWERLSGEAGCDAPMPWDSDAFHHESEDDPLGVGQKMWEVLRAEDGSLMKVLCWWMLPDFVIFNYELPPECAAVPALAHGYEMRKQQ